MKSVLYVGCPSAERADAESLLADAAAVEEAGAFAFVVESVPAELGAKITSAVSIPTIGICAVSSCPTPFWRKGRAR